MLEKPHNRLGNIGRQLCYLFDGWIIGGAVDYIAFGHSRPKDVDIIIPLDKWVQASKLIPYQSKSNSFGGFYFIDSNNIIVDVWTDDIARVLATCNSKAYQPKYNRILRTENV